MITFFFPLLTRKYLLRKIQCSRTKKKNGSFAHHTDSGRSPAEMCSKHGSAYTTFALHYSTRIKGRNLTMFEINLLQKIFVRHLKSSCVSSFSHKSTTRLSTFWGKVYFWYYLEFSEMKTAGSFHLNTRLLTLVLILIVCVTFIIKNLLFVVFFILFFVLLFLLTESLLMRCHLIPYDRKPLIYQSVLPNYMVTTDIHLKSMTSSTFWRFWKFCRNLSCVPSNVLSDKKFNLF